MPDDIIVNVDNTTNDISVSVNSMSSILVNLTNLPTDIDVIINSQPIELDINVVDEPIEITVNLGDADAIFKEEERAKAAEAALSGAIVSLSGKVITLSGQVINIAIQVGNLSGQVINLSAKEQTHFNFLSASIDTVSLSVINEINRSTSVDTILSSQMTHVLSLTGGWESTHTTVNANSAKWETAYYTLSTKEDLSNKKTSISGSNINHTFYPTTSAVYDFVNVSVLDAGAYSLPTIDFPNHNTITLGDGVFAFASSNDGKPPINVRNIPGNSYAITSNAVNYVLARYNNGSPDIIVSTSNATVNNHTVYPIYVVASSTLSSVGYVDLGQEAKGLANQLSLRIARTNPIEPEAGGLRLGVAANRRTTITGGDVWFGSDYDTLAAVNSEVNEQRFWRHNGPGVWDYKLDSQFNNEAWDNGSFLVELTNNRYAVTYVYRSIGVDSNIIHFIVGRGDYSLGEAQAAPVPSDIPFDLTVALFVGRIITKKFGSAPTQVDSAFDTKFTFSGVSDHEALANLQGGLAGDHSHLTALEYIYLQGLIPILTYDGVNTNIVGGLTVSGNISSTNTIFANGGNSNQWNSNYTTVNSNSSKWETSYNTTNTLSAGWESTRTTVQANSAQWANNGSDVSGLSSNWENTYLGFKSLSGGWESTKTTVGANSGKWESVYTTVNSNSATWGTGGSVSGDFVPYVGANKGVNLGAQPLSASNIKVNPSGSFSTPSYSFTNDSDSGIYGSGFDAVNIITGGSLRVAVNNFATGIMNELDVNGPAYFNNTAVFSGPTTVSDTLYVSDGTSLSPSITFTSDTDTGIYHAGANVLGIATGGLTKMLIGPIDTTVSGAIFANGGNSNQWNSSYTTVQANSAQWANNGSDVSGLSGGWESTKTTVNANSGKWESVYTTVNANSAVWGTGGTPVSGDFVPYVGANKGVNLNVQPLTASNFKAANSPSNSTPSYSFANDTNTGLYGNGFDMLGLNTNGSIRVRVDDTTTTIHNDLAVNGNGSFYGSVGFFSPVSIVSTLNVSGLITASGGDSVKWTNAYNTVSNTSAGYVPYVGANKGVDLGGQSLSSNIVKVSNGTAAAPSYSFLTDTDTGIYHPFNDVISFNTGGIARLVINNAGTTMNNDFTVNGTTQLGVLNAVAPATFYDTVSINNNLSATGVITANGGNSDQWNQAYANSTNVSGTFVPYLSAVRGVNLGIQSLSANSIRTANGTTALPAYSFISDPDTGILRPGSNTLVLATGGATRVTVSSSGAVFSNGLTSLGPAGFNGETTFNNTVGVGGVFTASSNFYSYGPAVFGSSATFTNSVYVDTPSYFSGIATFNQDANFNSNVHVDLGIITASGGDSIQWTQAYNNSSNISAKYVPYFGANKGVDLGAQSLSAGSITVNGGSQTLPAYTFVNDTDTGMYRQFPNVLGFTTGGSLRATITTTSTNFLTQINTNAGVFNSAGTAALPSYTFLSDTDTGIYGTNNNDVNITTGGVLRLGITNSNTTVSNGFIANSLATFNGNVDFESYVWFYGPVVINEDLQVAGVISASGGNSIQWTNAYNTVKSTSGNFVPYTGANQSVNLGANNFYTSSNIGIGTTATEAQLHIQNSVSGDSALTFQKWGWGGDLLNWGLRLDQYHHAGVSIDQRFVQKASGTDYNVLTFKQGKVGIGNPFPTEALDVVGNIVSNGNLTINGNITGNGSITSKFTANNGSAALPSFTFASDTNTGMYRGAEDVLAFTTGGVIRGFFNQSGQFTANSNAVFANAAGSGVGIGGIASATEKLTVTGDSNFVGNISATNIRVGNGTNAAPSYSFASDTNTGIYSGGADIISFATNGGQRMAVGTTSTTVYNFLLANSDATVNGNLAVNSIAIFNASIYGSLGNTSNLSYTFFNDNDTGIYNTGNNDLVITTGGTDNLIFTDSSNSAYIPFIFNSTTEFNGTASFNTNTNFYGPASFASTILIYNPSNFAQYTTLVNDGAPNTLAMKNAEAGNTNHSFRLYGYDLAGTYIRAELNSGTNGFAYYGQVATVQNGSNLPLVLTPAGNGAIVAGPLPDGGILGGNNRGSNATDLQTSRTVNDQVAVGSRSSIGGGINNKAGSIANRIGGGSTNTTGGLNSTIGGGTTNSNIGASATVAGGSSNQITASVAAIAGGSVNIANSSSSSIPGGSYGTTRGILGYHAKPFCSLPLGSAFNGASQGGELTIARLTSDATPNNLTSDSNNIGNATNQIALPINSAYIVEGKVISTVSGGTEGKAWTFIAAITKGADNASTRLIGTPTITVVGQDAGAATWALTVVADTTNGALQVSFTGQAGKTIRTVGQITTAEVTF